MNVLNASEIKFIENYLINFKEFFIDNDFIFRNKKKAGKL